MRVIVLTMSNQSRHVAEALRLGASGYLLKGAPASELLTALDEVGKGKRYLSADVAELALLGLTAPDDAALSTLSVRERQIVVMVVNGHSSNDIGRVLHLSRKTVDSYRSRFMAKLATPDVPSLVRFAIRTGLVDMETTLTFLRPQQRIACLSLVSARPAPRHLAGCPRVE